MGRFLRDQYIKNINIDENALNIINDFFINKFKYLVHNATNNKQFSNKETDTNRPFLSYIIRFDQKGYRLFDFKDLLKNYKQAKEVERIIFTLETPESIKTNQILGTYLELKLDSKDPNNCSFVVSSDDENFVSSSFSDIQDILQKYHNKSGLIRNNWTQFLIQIFGVIFGFVLSLWAGIKISPFLSIDNAFVISFLFIFLIFSNTWTFLYNQIKRAINYSFPNLRFKREGKEALHWLIQSLIAGLILAFTLFLLGKTFEYLGRIFGSFIK